MTQFRPASYRRKNRDAMIIRLDRVRTVSHNLGYGVGGNMDFMLAKYAERSTW
jgi:hypothetical protein